jgi:hypothetical protein
MKIIDATVKDILQFDNSISVSDAEDLLLFADPHDTIEEAIDKLYGEPRGECAI